MAAKTRLSLDGYGARRAGSFASKEASEEPVAEAPPPKAGMIVNVGRLMNR